MERSETILAFIRDELLDDPDTEISDDTSLFQSRLLSSLKLVNLILFLEETFEIKIDPSEVTIENLDSVRDTLVYLEKKTAK